MNKVYAAMIAVGLVFFAADAALAKPHPHHRHHHHVHHRHHVVKH